MNAEHADLKARFAAPPDRGLPPGRHELHREILMNHMLTESGQAPAAHRRPRRRMLAIGGAAGFGIAAAAVAVTLIATSASKPPAAPRSLAGGPAASRSAKPTNSATSAVSSPLVLLADNISASAGKQPGNATLVFRSTTSTDGQAPGSGYDLYTDSGPYYWSPTKSGLPGQIAAHHNRGGALFSQEIAAAEYAVHGNLATARERMAWAPADAGPLPSARMSPALLKVKAELLGVKPKPGQSLAAAYDKAWLDSWVWSDATDALEAGAGNPQVRAGVLRLLSTVSGVEVTHSTLDGQPTLVVADITPGPDDNGNYESAMILNATTGIPLEYTSGPVGKAAVTTTTYQVSRVTIANILAGKF